MNQVEMSRRTLLKHSGVALTGLVVLNTMPDWAVPSQMGAKTQLGNPINLSIKAHDIFLDPSVIFKGQDVTIGVTVSLSGTKVDLDNLLTDLGLATITVRIGVESSDGIIIRELTIQAADFDQDFGQAVVSTTVTMPAEPASNLVCITVIVDPNNAVPEACEDDNTALIRVHLRKK